MNYEYKVVAFIGSAKRSDSADLIAGQLTDTINGNAVDGWELFQMGDVNVEVKPGCLAGLFGANVAYICFDQIVFRRQRLSGTDSPDQAVNPASS